MTDGQVADLDSLGQPELWGPLTERPFIVIDLAQSPADSAGILADMACPILGIGQGPLAPACDVVVSDGEDLRGIIANIRAAPIAASVLVQHLRLSADRPAAEVLTLESLAYAALQQGAEYKRWSDTHHRVAAGGGENRPTLRVERQAGTLTLTLDRPAHHNAIDADLRDRLCEALDVAALDPEVETVRLEGAGRCFSMGGDVSEFGTIGDPATAHAIRMMRLPARRLLPVRHKLVAHIHGPAVGAGIEMATFAAHISASPDAWFQLPELKYGLIPGAGGTASVVARIGRQRAARWMLSMKRLSARVALDWGLIDAIDPR